MATPLPVACAPGVCVRIGAAVAVSMLVAALYVLVASPRYVACARIESPREETVLRKELEGRLVALTEVRGLSTAHEGLDGSRIGLRQEASSVVIAASAASPQAAAALANGVALDALAWMNRASARAATVPSPENPEKLPPPFPGKGAAPSARVPAVPSPYLVALRAKWRQWEKQEQAPADDPLLAGLISEDAEIARLRKELSAAELALRQSLSHLTPRHPDVKRLSGTVETLHGALEVRIAGLIAEYRESLRRELTSAEATERTRTATLPTPATRSAAATAASAMPASPVAAPVRTTIALPLDASPRPAQASPPRLVLAAPPRLPDGRWCRAAILLGATSGLVLGAAWSLIAAWTPRPERLSKLLALNTLERRLTALAGK